MKNKFLTISAAAMVACTGLARAGTDITLSAGYYDLSASYGNPNSVPDPWYGSANTTFLGSAAEATSSDPDESALLFTNSGTTTVTLDQGVTVGTLTLWDSLIGTNGISIAPGQSVILSGTVTNSFDGSDIGLIDSTISFKLNGTSYNAVDSSSILNGYPAYDETQPWTKIDTITGGGTTAAPEIDSSTAASALTLLCGGMLLVGAKRRCSDRRL